MKKKEKLHYKNNLHFYFQIFVPEEATRETSTGVIEKVKADQCLTHLHHRAISKPRHEGFEPSEEQARELEVSSFEHTTGSSAIHRESRNRVARKEKQSGVRSLLDIFYFKI